MAELSDELPDNSPRFVLLSYPMTLVGCTLPILLKAQGIRAMVLMLSVVRILVAYLSHT